MSCPYFKKCGGCQLQNMDYPRQLSFKMAKAVSILGNFGHVSPILGTDQPLYYRCKTHVVFGSRGRDVITGYYRAFSHDLLPVSCCPLEHRSASAVVATLRRLAQELKIPPFNDETMTGYLRHAVIRTGHATGQLLVTLVTARAEHPRQKDLTRELVRCHPEIVSVVRSINDRYSSQVMGKELRTLYGPGTIEDRLGGLTFRISPLSFFQVNPPMAEKIYAEAVTGLNLSGRETLLDAYCGTGTIGMLAAGSARRVIGAELNAQAVEDARAGAERNGIGNISFAAADAGKYLLQLAGEGSRPDAVILDPPRSGCSPLFLEQLAKAAPPRIAYISCNLKTLARDLSFLTARGWRCTRIVPADMFPQTGHVETVCLLSKLSGAKHHINVQFDMEELDLTSAESKVTYDEIRDWVREHYGFHVSNLNIAQIKQRHGIIERENYNKPKSPDSRQPGCPEEKAKAIEAALKQFQMI